MINNFEKFLFLGVMILITFIGNGWKTGSASLLARGTNGEEGRSVSSVSVPFGIWRDEVAIAGGDTLLSGAAGTTTVREDTASLLGSEAGITQGPAQASPVAASNQGYLYPGAFVSSVFHRIADALSPSVLIQSGLVADLKTKEIYFDLNSERRWPIASITKLMTASWVKENMDQELRITLRAEDYPPEADGGNLKIGSTYTVKDLVKAMLTVSSNEAAEALANAYGRANFIGGLNALARSWDLASTYFVDPTGLSPANQSTGNDLLKLAKKIYETHPDAFEATRQSQAVITELNSGKRETLKNINQFAGQKGFEGGKTGYTDDAGGNLLTIMTYEKRPVAFVVLGAVDRFGETQKLVTWFKSNFSLNL